MPTLTPPEQRFCVGDTVYATPQPHHFAHNAYAEAFARHNLARTPARIHHLYTADDGTRRAHLFWHLLDDDGAPRPLAANFPVAVLQHAPS